MPPSILSCLLLSFFLLLPLAVVESQTTSFEIDAFTPDSSLLTYELAAHVPPNTTFARLAPAYGSGPPVASVGRVLYTTPVTLWGKRKQSSFETTITQRGTPYYLPTEVYGWTFFVIPVNSTTDAGGYDDNLGIYNVLKPGSPYFTVEFDQVSRPPYDPDYAHVGININSLGSQNYTTLRYHTATLLVTARITYDAPTRLISVIATYGSTTVEVSFHFNLKHLLPEQVQVGLSASTGSDKQGAYFDFYTWHFNSTMGFDTYSLLQDDTDTYIKKYGM